MNYIIKVLISIALLIIAITTMMIAVITASALIMLLTILMSATASVLFVQLHSEPERINSVYNGLVSSYQRSADKMLTRRGLIDLIHVIKQRIELVNSVLSFIYMLVTIVSVSILFAGVYQNGTYFNIMTDIITGLGYSPLNVTLVTWSVTILTTTAIETYRNKLISRKERATNIFYAKILP